MTKITYLLGAGSSCGIRIRNNETNFQRNVSLPLVDEIHSRIVEIISIIDAVINLFTDDSITLSNILQDYKYRYNLQIDRVEIKNLNYKYELEKLRNELLKLSTDVENHASIDTFAKKTYFVGKIKNELNFDRVKQLIDLFFIIEHFLLEFDLRYDLFLASVLYQNDNKQISLPSEINVITWNYDFNFEYSFSRFLKLNNLLEVRKKMSSHIFELNEKHNSSLSERFKLFTLNGKAGGFYFKDDFYSDSLDFKSFLNFNPSEKITFNTNDTKLYRNGGIALSEDFKKYIENFFKFILQKNFLYNEAIISSPIKFAWEYENKISVNEYGPPDNAFIRTLRTSEILVIIGYSFPTFNRRIDKIILKEFLASYFLDLDRKPNKKIFLQVPDDRYEGIKSKIYSLINNERLERNNVDIIFPVEALNEFFIPFEFN